MADEYERLSRKTGVPREVLVKVVSTVEQEHRVKVEEEIEASLPPAGTLLKIAEAAKEFDVPESTVGYWVKSGQVPERERRVNEPGSPVLIDRRDVARRVAEGYKPHRDRRAPAAPAPA